MKIAWGITGGGHLLKECVDLILTLSSVDVFPSRAAQEVLRIYRLQEVLKQVQGAVVPDKMASTPIVGRFASGSYDLLVIAPATSNSVAKFVCGISDSQVSNLFAHANKCRVPIVVLPTDVAPEMDTVTPQGEVIKVYPRVIDLANTARLREFSGVTVAQSIEELQTCLTTYL
jgi:flavoprotein